MLQATTNDFAACLCKISCSHFPLDVDCKVYGSLTNLKVNKNEVVVYFCVDNDNSNNDTYNLEFSVYNFSY